MDPVTVSPDETIITVIRKHPINLLPVLASVSIILIGSIFFISWLTVHQAQIRNFVSVPTLTLLVLAVDGLMVVIGGLSVRVFRQNRIILTNVHLIQMTQNGLLNRSLSKFTLAELQDVRGSRNGLFATVLDFGDLLIETAAAKENFRFGPVGNPLRIAEIINDSHEKFESQHIYEHK